GYWENRPLATRADWSYELGQDTHSLTAAAGFVNPLGADGVNGWDGSTSNVQIVDDGDAGFSKTGSWSTLSNTGRSGDSELSAAGASAQASWSFSGLAAGYYQVATSWPFNTTNNAIAASADYALYDGSTLIGNRVVSQYFTQTNDFTDAGTGWR